MAYKVGDLELTKTKALPAAVGSVSTAGLYVSPGVAAATGPDGEFLADVELEISAPILTTTELPDTETMIYKVEHDDDPVFGTVADLYGADVLTQTGAGAAGAAAATKRVKLPADVKRYVRVTATGSTSIGSCVAKSVTAKLLA